MPCAVLPAAISFRGLSQGCLGRPATAVSRTSSFLPVPAAAGVFLRLAKILIGECSGLPSLRPGSPIFVESPTFSYAGFLLPCPRMQKPRPVIGRIPFSCRNTAKNLSAPTKNNRPGREIAENLPAPTKSMRPGRKMAENLPV